MISHHPTEATLGAYATGDLPEALAFVVATHLTYCPQCCNTVSAFEHESGAQLEATVPAEITAGALERVLARLDTPPPASHPVLHPGLPPPLDRAEMGRWWPIGPGMRWRHLRTGGLAWAGLLLLRPHCAFPPHRHTGRELTCVLAGCFSDGRGMFRPGDLLEPSYDHDQPLSVIGDQPCLCLVGCVGLRLTGFRGNAQRALEWVSSQARREPLRAAGG